MLVELSQHVRLAIFGNNRRIGRVARASPAARKKQPEISGVGCGTVFVYFCRTDPDGLPRGRNGIARKG